MAEDSGAWDWFNTVYKLMHWAVNSDLHSDADLWSLIPGICHMTPSTLIPILSPVPPSECFLSGTSTVIHLSMEETLTFPALPPIGVHSGSLWS